MRLQVNTDRMHIANNLLRRFFKGKIEAAFFPFTGFIGKVGSQTCFARAGCARNKN